MRPSYITPNTPNSTIINKFLSFTTKDTIPSDFFKNLSETQFKFKYKFNHTTKTHSFFIQLKYKLQQEAIYSLLDDHNFNYLTHNIYTK
jgi:hypothetical protein